MRTRGNVPSSNYILGWSDAEEDSPDTAGDAPRADDRTSLPRGRNQRRPARARHRIRRRGCLDDRARLVGPSGEVVGIERNADYMARARARVAAVGYRNVTFVHADLNDIGTVGPFDAAVGRLILTFFPDPVSVLRSVSRLLLPRGVVAIIEPCVECQRSRSSASVPLFSRLLTVTHESSAAGHRYGERAQPLSILSGRRAARAHNASRHGAWPRHVIAELQTELLRRLLPRPSSTAYLWRSSATSTRCPIVFRPSFARRGRRSAYVAMVSAWSRKTT